MKTEWNDGQPIYRQLRDRVVAMILEGVLKEGDALPSVRTVAADYRVNPLTVLKGYQELVDEGLVESKRGLGMFVKAGASELLLKSERQNFLQEEWPFFAGRVAANPRDDPATGAKSGRIAQRGCRGRGDTRWGKTERGRGGTLTRWHA